MATFTETTFPNLVLRELRQARQKHPLPLKSTHEGYAVILEELCEFWDELRKKNYERDADAMLAELVQISAMAQRCAEDVVLQQEEIECR